MKSLTESMKEMQITPGVSSSGSSTDFKRRDEGLDEKSNRAYFSNDNDEDVVSYNATDISFKASNSNFQDVLTRLGQNDATLKAIDLSAMSLDSQQLDELNDAVMANSVLGYIKWGRQPLENNSFIGQIEKKLISNNLSYRYFASDYVYGLLSMHSYIDSKEGDFVKFDDNTKDRALLDWKVYKVYDRRKENGYYGASYINEQSQQVILVHRGTELNFKELLAKDTSLKAHIKGVMGGAIIAQQVEAYAITKELVEEAQSKSFSFSVSGHSLGAYFAELSAYYCYFDFDYPQVKAVTFDSPGSKAMMDKYQSHVISKKTNRDVTDLDLVTYLSIPSILNTCNEHVGTVYRLYPKIEQHNWLEKMNKYGKKLPFVGANVEKKLTALRNLCGYSLLGMIEQFDSRTGLPIDYEEVLDWPCAQYTESSGAVKSAIDSVIDKVPFSSYVPDFLKKGVSSILSGGINKLIGERTIVSLIDVLADMSSDNFKQEEYWSYLQYVDSSNNKLKANLTSKDEFQLSYNGHYKSQPVDMKKVILSSLKGNLDWYIKKLDKHKLKLANSEHVSSITQNQVTELTQLFGIKMNRGSDWLVTKNETAEQVKQKIRRTVEVISEITWAITQIERGAWVVTQKASALAVDIPVARNVYFTGREENIESLNKILSNEQVVVISAYGGTGKTTLAVEYGYRQRDKGRVVRWFGEHRVEEGYRRLAVELGVPVDSNDKDLIKILVNSKLSQQNGQGLLFIFDNVENNAEVDSYVRDLPKNVRLIITSRQKGLIKGYTDLYLEPFDHEQAITYVKKVLRINDRDAALLVNTVGTLPFSLGKATAYLEDNKLMDVKDYIELYRGIKSEKPEVEIVLGRLIEKEKGNPQALQFLQYCSYLHADFIPLKLFEDVYSKHELQEIIKKLEQLSLGEFITNADGEKGIRVHRLIQEEIKRYASLQVEYFKNPKEIGNQLITKIDELFPFVEKNPDERWKAAALYITNVESLLKYDDELALQQDKVANLYSKLGEYHTHISLQFADALEKQLKSLEIRQSIYDGNHPDVASSLNYVGDAYEVIGDAEKALEYFEQALKMRQALYPDNHADIADSLNNVGVAYGKLGDYKRSLEYKEQALKMRQALYPGNHPNIADSLNNIGAAYGKLGDAKKALEYKEQALKIYQVIYPANHAYVALSLNNIGTAYKALGDTEKALEHHERTLKMVQALYPGNHPSIAISLNNIGITYKALGDTEKALEYYDQALSMYQILYPGNHRYVADLLNNIGAAYGKLGNAEKALEYKEQALRMRQALYPGAHKDVADLLNNIGAAYGKLGNAEKALEYKEQALRMRQALYPGAHKDVADSLNHVGFAYDKLRDEKKALEYKEQALRMRQALYPGVHKDVADSLYDIGIAYTELNDFNKSLECFEQALNMYQALYPGNHSEVAVSLNRVGVTYHRVGNFNEALKYLEQALSMYQILYPDNHPKIAELRNNIGIIYGELGDEKKTIKHKEFALNSDDVEKKTAEQIQSEIMSLIPPLSSISLTQSSPLTGATSLTSLGTVGDLKAQSGPIPSASIRQVLPANNNSDWKERAEEKKKKPGSICCVIS